MFLWRGMAENGGRPLPGDFQWPGVDFNHAATVNPLPQQAFSGDPLVTNCCRQDNKQKTIGYPSGDHMMSIGVPSVINEASFRCLDIIGQLTDAA